MDAPYATTEQLEPGIARVLAHNPSAFTYFGTQTYLIGTDEVAVIDPGPDLPEHLDALESAIGGRRVAAIMCTHTHRDHSPAARPQRGRWRSAPARRSSVAHRWRSKRSGRAPTRRSTATMRLTGCLPTARRSRWMASP
jgi:glyoxylase-like metal-dependent hydrolase (beta-lactamase superfamily II)